MQALVKILCCLTIIAAPALRDMIATARVRATGRQGRARCNHGDAYFPETAFAELPTTTGVVVGDLRWRIIVPRPGMGRAVYWLNAERGTNSFQAVGFYNFGFRRQLACLTKVPEKVFHPSSRCESDQ
jgi:hypothetical protein